MLKKTAAIALSAAILLPAAAVASGAALKLNDEVKSEITTRLQEQGYWVGKIKVEDGMYEVYAKKDGEKLEVLLNGDLDIVKTEMD